MKPAFLCGDIFPFISIIIFLVWVSDSWCWWVKVSPSPNTAWTLSSHGCKRSPCCQGELVYTLKLCVLLFENGSCKDSLWTKTRWPSGRVLGRRRGIFLLLLRFKPSPAAHARTHNLLEAQRWSSMWFMLSDSDICTHERKRRGRIKDKKAGTEAHMFTRWCQGFGVSKRHCLSLASHKGFDYPG